MTEAKAYYAGGCFWGVEHLFQYKEGVISAVSGYMGGSTKDPSYDDVCYGNTGHLEVVKLEYNPSKISYEELVKFFFEIHDFTQIGGQGTDIGEEYISAIFYKSYDEKKVIRKIIEILISKGYEIATLLLPVDTFWKAEEYHQDYYDKKKQQAYCHMHQKIF